MKCKKEFCHNEVTRPKMVYCSRECAPYGWMCSDEKVRARLGKKGVANKNAKKSAKNKKKREAASLNPVIPQWALDLVKLF